GQTVQLQATDKQIFNLTISTPVALDSSSSYKATATFTARVAGVTGASTAGAIQAGAIIASPAAGLQVDATVTPTVVTAGRDPETSVALAQRCLASWNRLGAGWTEGSLDY